MTTVYFAGGEDSELFTIGGGNVITTAGRFRANARCALQCATNVTNGCYWVNTLAFAASVFWFSGWHSTTGGSIVSGASWVRFLDSSLIPRLRLRQTSGGLIGTWVVEKVDAAGTATQLGSSFSLTVASSTLEKLDVSINYAVAGSVTVYYNGIQLFTFSGDTTTNSVTSLAYFQVGALSATGGNTSVWSELLVLDTDTRSLTLQTLAPVANGNTHNFDTGSPAAANVNEITLNDSTIDGSTTAGQIDEYTIPSIISGSFTIMAVGVSARLQKGATGPSKMDLVLRSGSTDYFSSDQVLTTAFACYQNWWTTDPNTSATWATLPVNIGLKSVT